MKMNKTSKKMVKPNSIRLNFNYLYLMIFLLKLMMIQFRLSAFPLYMIEQFKIFYVNKQTIN